MTTLVIKRRKQPIGFLTSIKIITQDGNTVRPKAGETVTITTNFPEELLVKKFFYTKKLTTGISDNPAQPVASLELYYNLSHKVIAGMYIGACIILFFTGKEIFAHRISVGILPLLFIIIASGLIQRSLAIQKTEI